MSIRFFNLTRRPTGPVSSVSGQAMSGIVTNQWYSSLYFHDWSEKMFAYPLAYQLSEKGLGISYPKINASEKTVFGSYIEEIVISLDGGISKKEVIAPDIASVGLKLCSAQSSCFSTRLAHGSPSVVVTVDTDTTVTLIAQNQTAFETSPGLSKLDFGKTRYALAIKNNGALVPLADRSEVKEKNILVKLTQQDQLFITLVPDEGVLEESQLGAAITGVSFSYGDFGAKKTNGIGTRIFYLTEGNREAPLIALLPHQWKDRTDEPIGTYQTLRGQQKLYKEHQIFGEYTKPDPLTVSEMFGALDEVEQQKLANLLQPAAKETIQMPAPSGVYDNGKHVFKLAQLLEIASVTKSPVQKELQDRLTAVLTEWLGAAPSTSQSPFELKDSPKGLIAKKGHEQYGNELFNDHHFHYGYYLAATGILLDQLPDSEREALLKKLQPGLEPMITDVANEDMRNGFPFVRSFDPYESHSWADGRALAGDGNNQESTSEAITRWYGLYRLGRATNRQNLVILGQTGWAMEQEGARIYWLGQRPDLFAFPEGYKHPMASLVWGGKYDFGTWFSGLPTHIYGIQFLPISPAMTHISDPKTWQKYGEYNLQATEPNAWNDIMYMLAAANGQKEVAGQPIPTELKSYEGGNTAPWYYLWVSYWLKK